MWENEQCQSRPVLTLCLFSKVIAAEGHVVLFAFQPAARLRPTTTTSNYRSCSMTLTYQNLFNSNLLLNHQQTGWKFPIIATCKIVLSALKGQNTLTISIPYKDYEVSYFGNKKKFSSKYSPWEIFPKPHFSSNSPSSRTVFKFSQLLCCTAFYFFHRSNHNHQPFVCYTVGARPTFSVKQESVFSIHPNIITMNS